MNPFGRRVDSALRRRTHLVRQWMAGNAHSGFCPVCETKTFFIKEGPSLRDSYYCRGCASLPHARAFLEVLQEAVPNWRDLSLHESSPGGPVSEKLFRECPRYLPSHYNPAIQRGEVAKGVRGEDLCAQTFPAHRFDLVVTLDVFEHLFSPRDGFTEIARTLKPGGALVFTTRWYPDRLTRLRARRENGGIVHHENAVFHQDPMDENGSLLVTDWGRDLPMLIHTWSGLFTTVYRVRERRLGIEGPMCEVFVSRKTQAGVSRA